jgi:hypothetical protein
VQLRINQLAKKILGSGIAIANDTGTPIRIFVCLRRFAMQKDITMDKLDPARTALVVVHVVQGVAGEVDTCFQRIFRPPAFGLSGGSSMQARFAEDARGNSRRLQARPS